MCTTRRIHHVMSPLYNAEGQCDDEGQRETCQESVKRSDTKQAYQNYPQPSPTRDGSLLPARRVHIWGEDPEPDVEEAVPQRTKMRQPIVIKKIETHSSSSAPHPSRAVMDSKNQYHHPPCHPWKMQKQNLSTTKLVKRRYYSLLKYGQS